MSAQALNPPVILLIDDNAGDIRLITEAVLAVVPAAEVRSVTDSTQAVPRLKESLGAMAQPNLVLLDLLLPKLDGFKVLERLRQYPDKSIAQTKVIVLSNLWSDKDILRAQALKVDEYYVKANTDLNVVYERIDQIMTELL